MSDKKFEMLSDEERLVFLDGLKTYLGYEAEIKETKTSQKEQIKRVAELIEDWKPRDVRKLFTYFKKHITATELREDADTIEEIQKEMK
jgi:TRAP-type C4-dicarboxylate transport system substrate-binding protein